MTALTSFASLLGLSIALFVSTNLDDIFVLVVFFSDARFRPRGIVLGQLLGIALLAVGSFALSLAAARIPTRYIGLLGVLPFLLGARMFVRGLLQRRRRSIEKVEKTGGKTSASGMLAVTLVTLANGADNVTAYVPFFATRKLWQSVVTLAVFGAMTAVWCFVAYRIVKRADVGTQLKKYGPVLLPWVLMFLGGYLFVEGGALELVR